MSRHFLFLGLSVFVFPVMVSGQGVYYFKDGQIKWVDRTGGTPMVVSEDSVGAPTKLIVDPSNSKLYRSNWAGSSELDGSNYESFARFDTFGPAFAVDVAAEDMYYGDRFAQSMGRVFRSKFDGSQKSILIQRTPGTFFTGIALDTASGKIYWSEWRYQVGGVYKADLNGSNITLLANLNEPHWGPQQIPTTGLSLDSSGQRLYWLDDYRRIYSKDVNGIQIQPPHLIYEDPSSLDITALTVDSFEDKVYWAVGKRVWRSDLDGGNVELRIDGSASAYADIISLAVDQNGRVFLGWVFAGWGGSFGHGDGEQEPWWGAIERCDGDGSNLVLLAKERFGAVAHFEADYGLGYLFTSTTDAGSVSRTQFTGATSSQLLAPSNLYNTSLRVDSESNRVVWGDLMDFDEGTPSNVAVIETTGTVADFVSNGRYVDVLGIDEATGKAYYYSSSFRIWSVSLDGCCAETQVAVLGPPQWPGYQNHEIVLDYAGQKIYWAGEDSNVPGTGEIRRTSFGVMNGSYTVVVGGLAEVPSHLLLDVASQKIYWYSQNAIQRANLNGTGVQLVAASVPTFPTKMDIDLQNEELYWLTFEPDGPGSIYRSSLDGSGVNLVVQENNIASFVVDKRAVVCERTSLYADLTGLPNIVEFQDISAVVDAFRGQPVIAVALCDLYPCDAFGQECVGDGIIDFRDVSLAVDAFRGYGCH